MVDDRGALVEKLAAFLRREPPEKTKVLVLEAAHRTGLTTTLDAVRERDPQIPPEAVVDDAQRVADLERLLVEPPRRVLLGVDSDDQRDLSRDVIPTIKSLESQGLLQARHEPLPAPSSRELARIVIDRLPSTREDVAIAVGRRLEGRIADVDAALALPDVQVRVRDEGIRMVRLQVERLALETEDLLEQRWISVSPDLRRIALALAYGGPRPISALEWLASALDVDGTAALADAGCWIDVRGEALFAGKGVRRLWRRLIIREAPVALETKTRLDDEQGKGASLQRLPRKPSGAKPRPAAPSPRSAGARRPAALVQRELDRFRQDQTWTDPRAITLRRELTAALRDEGKLAAARKNQQTLVTRLERAYPPRDPRIPEARLLLAEILAASGSIGEARRAFGKAIAVLSDLHGDDSPQVRAARRRRAVALKHETG